VVSGESVVFTFVDAEGGTRTETYTR
jgi:hypothetical protein